MRKVLAAAATAGVMALGLAAAPAQATTTAQDPVLSVCQELNILLTDFHLIDTAAPGSRNDGLFDRGDLRAIAAGKNNPSPLLRQVARTLPANAFGNIDTQVGKLPMDGLVSRDDLRAVKRVTHQCK